MRNKQIKIRKRNINNRWIINNSLSSNTISINILNKTKFREKINSKNMTHDMPYASKIKNNLVNKLNSIQYSKERLRKQILNTGIIEQRLNKKIKINVILNKYRNVNNKRNFSKCYWYQNTKNAFSIRMFCQKKKIKKDNKQKWNFISTLTNEKNIRNKSNKMSNINSNHNILNNII